MYGTLIFMSGVIRYLDHNIAGAEAVCLIRLIRILQCFLDEFVLLSALFELCIKLLTCQVSRLCEGYLTGVFINR